MLVVVTPVKNEGKRLLDLAKQLNAQTTVPDLWIIVDDNSVDFTPKIIKQLETEYDFISGISLSEISSYDQVHRYGHIVQTGFTHALERYKEIAFLGILDSDMKLRNNYYEALIKAFNNFPQLGLASGLYVEAKNERFTLKEGADQALPVCGATMIFRKECFMNIGGFPTCPRPDTVAMLKAANRGWKIGIVSSTYAIHLRVNQSFLKYLKFGFASYSLGYHPVNAMLSGPCLALRNLSLSPFGFTIGYLIGEIRGTKIEDDEVKQYFSQSLLRQASKLFSVLSHRNVHPNPIEKSKIRL